MKFSLVVSLASLAPVALKSATIFSANASTVTPSHVPPAKSKLITTSKYSHLAYNFTSPWRPAGICSTTSPSNSALSYHPKKIAPSCTGSTNNVALAIVYVAGPSTSPHAPPLNS